MKATGIVRRIDALGRIVIPKEIRRNLHIEEGDALELFVEDDRIVFQKYLQSPADLAVECAKFVREHRGYFMGVNSLGNETTVFFINGKKATVTLNPKDPFDFNVAICHAMKVAGYTKDNPVCQ